MSIFEFVFAKDFDYSFVFLPVFTSIESEVLIFFYGEGSLLADKNLALFPFGSTTPIEAVVFVTEVFLVDDLVVFACMTNLERYIKFYKNYNYWLILNAVFIKLGK